MDPAQIELGNHRRGDKWPAWGIDGITDELGGVPAPPCLSCRLQFRLKGSGTLGYELSSIPATGKGTIIISDPVLYAFAVPEQALPLAVGVWEWDFETFETADATGLPETWLCGEITVGKDISHD